MLRTGNPVLNADTFQSTHSVASSNGMTVVGTAYKTLFLLALAVLSAGVTWPMVMAGDGANAVLWSMSGAIGGLVFALILRFKMHWAPYLAPAYALCQGLFLGALSAVFEARYPGIALQSIAATGGTLVTLLIAYCTRLIKPSQNFRLVLAAAIGGISIVYLIGFIGSFFKWQIPMIHESGPVGIAFSLFVVVVAALSLVIDFDYIENAAAAGTSKRMEWYGAFALLVTLVWLYIEMLKLLAKLRRRN